MIALDGIEKIYKTGNTVIHALKGISLNIERGEIFGIMGRAGAGKSALVRCINLLEHPSKGTVTVDSCDLTTLNTEALRLARRNIGMIFQHFNLLGTRTVFQNVALPLEISGNSKSTIEATILPILELTGLIDKKDFYPSQLNNVQKQRVSIARALVNKPKVLLCEEATASLDQKSKHSILQLLRKINKELQLTILLMTHELEVIKSICHRAAVLDQGEIVEQGSVIQLLTRPQSPITQEFIKAAARQDMPMTLRNRLQGIPSKDCNPILHISFAGPSDQEHFITYIVQAFTVSVNIIQAHLETIGGESIGNMIAEMVGSVADVKKATEFLEHKGLHIEVLGYAPHSI